MGTSAPNNGPRGSNPLIPDWITNSDQPADEQQSHEQPSDGEDALPADNTAYDEGMEQGEGSPNILGEQPQTTPHLPPLKVSRYKEPRMNFNRFLRSRGQDTNALKVALKGYSRRAAGSTTGMARRMLPATHRVSRFVSVLGDIQTSGKANTLGRFDLSSYIDRPVTDILSALSDVIFADTGQMYEDTQDDSIVRQAYCNTVNRIAEQQDIDLDNLTAEQIEVMTAIFIEETIAQRVINDIGEQLTKSNPDVAELIAIEEAIYQTVRGLVRNTIMPEIIATRHGDRQQLHRNIENIYRTAFDAMAGEND